MLKFSIALLSSWAVVASAQIALPYGKDLEKFFVPPADTLFFLEEGVDTLPSPKSAGFSTTIEDWTKHLPGGSITVDTANRLLRFSYASLGLAQRSGGKMVGTKEVVPAYPGLVGFSNWSFDAQGRRISEISGDSGTGGTISNLDTTRYIWTHDGCADDVWGDLKRVWTVDANGRCATGATYRLFNGLWRDEAIRKALIWNGDRLSQVFDMDVVGSAYDTIYKDNYTYDADGAPTGIESYGKTENGQWILMVRVQNTWKDGKFMGGQNTEYDAAGRTVWSLKVSVDTTPVARVRAAAPRGAHGMSVRATEAGLEFANATGFPMSVSLSSPQGKAIGALDVAAHGRAIVPRPLNQGLVIWTARSRAGLQTGRLLAGR